MLNNIIRCLANNIINIFVSVCSWKLELFEKCTAHCQTSKETDVGHIHTYYICECNEP